MKIITHYDSHIDPRRVLTAFDYVINNKAETKVLNITEDRVPLGNHSHRYEEVFILAHGKCVLTTWLEDTGKVITPISVDLSAGEHPVMIIIEANEEHVFVCEVGMCLIGFLPIGFKEENMIKAMHLE